MSKGELPTTRGEDDCWADVAVDPDLCQRHLSPWTQDTGPCMRISQRNVLEDIAPRMRVDAVG